MHHNWGLLENEWINCVSSGLVGREGCGGSGSGWQCSSLPDGFVSSSTIPSVNCCNRSGTLCCRLFDSFVCMQSPPDAQLASEETWSTTWTLGTTCSTKLSDWHVRLSHTLINTVDWPLLSSSPPPLLESPPPHTTPVTGDHLFVISGTCLVLSCFDVSDCHSPFSVMCIAFCADACLAQGHPVSLHSWDVICVFCDEKGVHWGYPCNHHLPDPFVRVIQEKRKNQCSFCEFLSCVSCIPSRTVYTERTYSHPQSGSGACGFMKRRGSCRAQDPAWVGIVGECQQWPWGRSWWLSSWKQRKTGRVHGWSISRRVDTTIYSRRWNHNEDSTSLLWINVLV